MADVRKLFSDAKAKVEELTNIEARFQDVKDMVQVKLQEFILKIIKEMAVPIGDIAKTMEPVVKMAEKVFLMIKNGGLEDIRGFLVKVDCFRKPMIKFKNGINMLSLDVPKLFVLHRFVRPCYGMVWRGKA